jgi:hypothetical protein
LSPCSLSIKPPFTFEGRQADRHTHTPLENLPHSLMSWGHVRTIFSSPDSLWEGKI